MYQQPKCPYSYFFLSAGVLLDVAFSLWVSLISFSLNKKKKSSLDSYISEEILNQDHNNLNNLTTSNEDEVLRDEELER